MTGTRGNLWQAGGSPEPVVPALDADVTADVAIMGGGITGLSAALHLSLAGAKVRLLEAQEIGHGGSGRNVGLVNAGLWTPPEQVIATLGPEAGARLNAALAVGPGLVFKLIERYQIQCDATRKGTLHCADTPAGARDLQDRFRQLRDMGAPVKLLDRSETAERTGSQYFNAALWDGRAGTIQPLGYTRGLRKAARAAGAVIHEGSPVRTVRRVGDAWEVATDKGKVTAAKLVQATNAYGIAGLLPRGFIPVSYFQLATEVLPDNLRERILPGGEGCWDTARVLTSLRLNAEGRLLIGAVGDLDALGSSVHRAWARRKLAQVYPQLSGLRFEFGWTGRIAMTPDHMPKVVNLGPGAVAIYGYSGRGIAPGTVFGKAAAGWAVSGDASAFPVAVSGPRSLAFPRPRGVFYEAGAVLTHMMTARL